ncbi:PTS glucitol/sorbitol transporter subunit IIA [Salinibacterium sp. NG253]|uniref:PTS glucitol/sorbitol transporter subunit IIA n=1 Tax=Salinibacterium sp. NG253 TaxID=2792039 RepID=UPI0018CFE64B|nr:PTS glucitol/sorbitol transporter subunit IIA [Salinibacterium sp. NG253]MBH0116253.1 PTS glucitol/sorbitol transporter subunit IIA [Salinibacterium sp. NG253]
MTTYYRSEVTSIGTDATEMFEGGVVIFFGEPCPAELAEVSVVHTVAHHHPQRDPRPGDVLRVGGSEVTITEVGEIAGHNLRTLGHFVVYSDPEDSQKVLPGAIHAEGTLSLPNAGVTIELIEGS